MIAYTKINEIIQAVTSQTKFRFQSTKVHFSLIIDLGADYDDVVYAFILERKDNI